MIQIKVNHEMFAYDMYHITKAFCPKETIVQEVDVTGRDAVSILYNQEHFAVREQELADITGRKMKKRYVNKKLYAWLSATTGKELAWGILTGVRPTKLIMGLLEEGMSEGETVAWMKEHYCVTERKANLGLQIAKKEKELLSALDYRDGFSLYIGIPFCPTTCSYCSFTSYPICKWKERVEEYLDAVCRELTVIGDIAKQKEKKLNTVYVGGGTPTTLEPEQLDKLLSHLEAHFSYEDLLEITVEAGRPDSITKEKLEVLKAHNIGRISINPQTMQQKTLDAVGRDHTVEDVKRVFCMARELGFDHINMDLIAGLPGETVEDMRDTLEQIQALAPDSLTVHALAMKRASRLMRESKEQENREEDMETAKTLSRMIELAADYAREMDLHPYYLYRQKNIAGNFENVGYAKVDKAGIYNILIMEEKQSIIAVGAGASTKIVLSDEQATMDPKTGNQKKIVRTENVKDVEQYINRIDEMIERKGELLWH